MLVMIVAGLFLLLGGAAVGYSFITQPTRTITVIGTGKKTIPPEQAVLSFSLLFESPSQQQAISGGETRFNQLLNAVNGFSPKSVDTTPYQVTNRNATRTAGTLATEPVYQYVNAARVTIEDTSKVSELIKALYDNGATVVGQVRYAAKDQNAVDRELQKLAVENATQKAREMARTGSARLGKVLTIQEGVSTGQTGTAVTGSQNSNTSTTPNPSNTSSGSSSEIELQAQVTVVYELW
jgi:uncharacterized protein YggE